MSNAKSEKSWQARIGEATDAIAQTFVESMSYDWRLYKVDVAGSIAHATMLAKVGLITDSVSHLSFEDALDVARRLGLSSVEVATGNWSEAPHADLDALVSSQDAREEFIGKISSRDLTLSALTANGNQLHPTSGK